LEELKSFKQRLIDLEEENRELKRRGDYEPTRLNIPEGNARSANRKRSGAAGYESTLN
jgi:hypothetical protein